MFPQGITSAAPIIGVWDSREPLGIGAISLIARRAVVGIWDSRDALGIGAINLTARRAVVARAVIEATGPSTVDTASNVVTIDCPMVEVITIRMQDQQP